MGQKLCLKVLRKSVLLLQGIVIVNWQFKDELFQMVGTFFINLKKKSFSQVQFMLFLMLENVFLLLTCLHCFAFFLTVNNKCK